MPANDAFTADGARLLAAFGETVVRWPLGDEGEAEEVTANVDLANEAYPAQLNWGGQRVRDDDGERMARRGLLDVLPGQSLDTRDRWEVRGQMWNTVRIEGSDEGLTTVTIERLEKTRTRKRRVQAR